MVQFTKVDGDSTDYEPQDETADVTGAHLTVTVAEAGDDV